MTSTTFHMLLLDRCKWKVHVMSELKMDPDIPAGESGSYTLKISVYTQDTIINIILKDQNCCNHNIYNYFCGCNYNSFVNLNLVPGSWKQYKCLLSISALFETVHSKDFIDFCKWIRIGLWLTSSALILNYDQVVVFKRIVESTMRPQCTFAFIPQPTNQQTNQPCN